MQLVKDKRVVILHPLQLAASVAEKRSAVPIYGNVLIRKEDGDLIFIGGSSDMQITVRTKLSAGPGTAETTVCAAKITSIIQALPDGPEVTLAVTDKRLSIQCGRSRSTMQTIPASDYPLMKVPDDLNVSLTVDPQELRKVLATVQFAMATQDIRYYLNGALLEFSDNRLTAVSTNGHRLALQASNVEGVGQRQIILPSRSVTEIVKLLEDKKAPVELDIGPAFMRVRMDEVELLTKLIEGKYPDYRRVMPKETPIGFETDRVSLLQSLQRTALMADTKKTAVRLVLATNVLTLSAVNDQAEDASEELDVDYSGEQTVDIGFNVTYLTDVLSKMACKRVRLGLTDSKSSAMITTPEDPNFQYTVMPMAL